MINDSQSSYPVVRPIFSQNFLYKTFLKRFRNVQAGHLETFRNCRVNYGFIEWIKISALFESNWLPGILQTEWCKIKLWSHIDIFEDFLKTRVNFVGTFISKIWSWFCTTFTGVKLILRHLWGSLVLILRQEEPWKFIV